MALLTKKRFSISTDSLLPTTWDEFAQQAEKLTQASGGKVKMKFLSDPRSVVHQHGLGQWRRTFKTQGDSVGSNAQPASVREGAHLLGWFDQEKARLDDSGL
jgi:ABC-type glycerol-3-phosphate transport system substrate-binding protein